MCPRSRHVADDLASSDCLLSGPPLPSLVAVGWVLVHADSFDALALVRKGPDLCGPLTELRYIVRILGTACKESFDRGSRLLVLALEFKPEGRPVDRSERVGPLVVGQASFHAR